VTETGETTALLLDDVEGGVRFLFQDIESLLETQTDTLVKRANRKRPATVRRAAAQTALARAQFGHYQNRSFSTLLGLLPCPACRLTFLDRTVCRTTTTHLCRNFVSFVRHTSRRTLISLPIMSADMRKFVDEPGVKYKSDQDQDLKDENRHVERCVGARRGVGGDSSYRCGAQSIA
jgi:hypothetical protein